MRETLRLLHEIQDGLPLVPRPYAQVGERLGMGEQEVIERIERAQHDKIIRRICAFVAHRRVGIIHNAMCVWDVPDESVEAAGEILASSPFVTHAYERPRADGWPYNIYAMIHSHKESEIRKIFEALTSAMGWPRGDMLFSVHEFKKQSLRI